MKNIGFGTRECSDVEFVAKVNLEDCFGEVLAAAAQTFRFTAEKKEKFENNELAPLMVAILGIADCEDAIHDMTLCVLVVLEGYKASKDHDVKHNQYNPLNDGTWNYEELKHSLVKDIKKNPCTDLHTIMPIQNRRRVGYWH